MLQHVRRPAPETLVRTFAARGVEVVIENEPVLALAELGRTLVEYRQQAARHATFHSNGAARSSQLHPSLILVIVEPADFDDVDNLIATIARAMRLVTVSSFAGGDQPGLSLIQRGRVDSTKREAKRDPAPSSPSATRGLRLTPDDRQPPPPAPSAPPIPAPWAVDLDDETDEAESEAQVESAESLISQAELAMLLGDDYGFGDEPPATERPS